MIDQTVWRGANSSVSLFARGGVAPSDRNLLSWYVDAGIGIKGPFPTRKDDILTFGVAYSQFGGVARALGRDTLAFSGQPYPIRSGETVLELSYIFQLTPWWTLQPDIQYIMRPEGGVPDPDNPNRKIGNVFLIGARTTVTF